MRWFDGTVKGKPKPVVHVLTFLARYLTTSSHWSNATNQTYDLDIMPTLPPLDPVYGISASFVFKGPDCHILGATSFNSTVGFRFEAEVPAVVMAYTQAGSIPTLTLHSSVDVTLYIQPHADPFHLPFTAAEASVTGRYGELKISGGTLIARVLAGEPIALRPRTA